MTTYEQLIVHALRHEPALCRVEGLSENLFLSGDCRKLFAGITALFKEIGTDGSIDLTILSAKTGISIERIGTIETGCYFPTGHNFADWIQAQQQENDKHEWAALYEKESSVYMKTGTVDLANVARVRELCDRLLNRNNNNGLPAGCLKSGTELQALDISVEWTVERLQPARSLALWHSRGGLGKTFLALGMAKAVSTGTRFLGLETMKRPVFYIDFENPLPLLVERVRKLDIRDVNFWHLSASTRPPKLDGPDWTLYKKVLAPGSLVIFDTLRAAHDGDENSSQDAAVVMSRLKEIRELGHDIVALHHTNKADDRRYKGSTAFSDLADHVLDFHRVRRGNLEEIDDDSHDPDAIFSLGTGEKTRFAPFRLYLTFDPIAGVFATADDPDMATLDALADYIAGPGKGQHQAEIIAWAKEELGGKRKQTYINLLARGEQAGRWKSYTFNRRRIYDPA